MRHPAGNLRIPEQIRLKTVKFLEWYVNEIHVHEAPFRHRLHAENGEFEYDWRPRKGISRLTLSHIESGLIAVNAFDFTRIGDTDPATMPPPASLLMATWLDLCTALEWIGEGDRAVMADALNEATAADTHLFGEPIYG